MTSRGHSTRDDRDRDRRRTARDDRAPIRDDPPVSSRGGRGEKLNDFFVDGKGIHREVLQREICKYLGPEAYSRPYNYNGVSGYTITAVRPFTSQMLDDLQELSRSYEAENRQAIRRGHQDIPYENSRTHQQAILNQGPEDLYDQSQYQSRLPYSMPGTQPSYVASSRPEYPPQQAGHYQSSLYTQGPGYPSGPSYPPGPVYPGTARPGTQDSYGTSYDMYGDESPRPSYAGGTRRDGRMDTRVEPRETRLDARPDPRGPDSRAYPVADPRMDPRDIRDSRTDPRMMPAYSYPVNSPADVPMRGYNDDYVNAPLGRGVPTYAPPSRVVQTGYESRESPQMRDPYRHEPIREERRSRR